MDLALEFLQQEALSMMNNNDQSGSITTTTGAEYGLRGLNSYPSSTTAASFGTNGSALDDGIHTVLTVPQTGEYLIYNDIANLASALPAQYWNFDTTCWMMHPTTIRNLRELTGGTSGLPVFLEVGDEDGSAVGNIFGHCVCPNPYMDVEGGVGKFPVYLADWSRFVTIADNEEFVFKRFEQTQPGFVTLYAEKRMVSTIRDVYAGVRLSWFD
jgi:HK97 family phage major capsid protein